MGKSACDTCRDPGYCCRGIPISVVFPAGMPRDKVNQHIAEGTDPYGYGREAEPTPMFDAIRVQARYIHRGQTKPDGETWSFSCRWLGVDGRCTDYENRPNLCRTYPPKIDSLCIEYEGSWKGRLTLYREKE